MTNNWQEPEMLVELAHGQLVCDRESDDDSRMVILRLRDTPARAYHIGAIDQTVAEANPDYEPHEPVVDVAFVADIEDAVGSNWEADDIVRMAADDQLERADIQRYAYPITRLAEITNEDMNAASSRQ
ncbi:hypothetical protein [Halococcus thailandensis]|uniref:Uncharacterized protein n=1 Tax=Halococcus thailandensis JCM 13552 TaxID=1227457 RepID=M0NER9_9EURY|nr:hypothetical protein [Halococcus thailandensis]EMA56033.1 hypothetical protein C451_04506 [Halococcus thailandensis JCM 13552]